MQFSIADDSPVRRPDFLYGVATAAFQIEGATKEGGRVDSIWDTFCAEPGRVLNGDSGDPACDHYHRWEEDLDLILSLGVDAYRLSIAWPRIMSAPGTVNETGLAFYEAIVDGLIKRGIKPVVTLYHWDLPQYLEDRGGWLNRQTAYEFAEYARVVTERLGNRVTHWATLNEPFCSSFLSYKVGVHAPGYRNTKWAYQAAHHLLLAHGLALPHMRRAAPESQHGIVLNFTPAYPATDSDADREAVRQQDELDVHWFIHPLLTGSYPEGAFARHPEHEPVVLPGDMTIISQGVDYIGVNFYTRHVVSAGVDGPEIQPPGDVEITHIGWEVYPDALRDLLIGLNKRYTNLPPLIITENGMAGDDHVENGAVHDKQRILYYSRHLAAIGEAMHAGVDVRGYFAWSLMDNFEWAFGYSQRFGLVYVNYETQDRIIKDSGHAFADWVKNGRLQTTQPA